MINTEVLFGQLVAGIGNWCFDSAIGKEAIDFFSSPVVKPRLLEAPASTAVRFHHAYAGGLLEHSLQVFDYAIAAAGNFPAMLTLDREQQLRSLRVREARDAAQLSVEERSSLSQLQRWWASAPLRGWDIFIAALLHDLHKIGDASGKPNFVPNILKNGKRSEAIPYESNPAVNILLPYTEARTSPMERSASLLLTRNLDFLPEGELSLALVGALAPKLLADLRPGVLFAIRHHDGMYGLGRRELAGKETFLQQVLHFADMVSSRGARWLDDQNSQIPPDPAKLM